MEGYGQSEWVASTITASPDAAGSSIIAESSSASLPTSSTKLFDKTGSPHRPQRMVAISFRMATTGYNMHQITRFQAIVVYFNSLFCFYLCHYSNCISTVSWAQKSSKVDAHYISTITCLISTQHSYYLPTIVTLA